MRKRFLRILRNSIIIALAYVYSLELIVFIVLGVKLFAKSREDVLLVMGITCLFHAAHSFVGYICGWEHVYCSYSNRKNFIYTLDTWQAVGNEEGYGVPAIFGFFGIALIAGYVYFRYF